MKNTLRSLATASALVLMATSGALAEWKPSGPITMLIGFAAGGGAVQHEEEADRRAGEQDLRTVTEARGPLQTHSDRALHASAHHGALSLQTHSARGARPVKRTQSERDGDNRTEAIRQRQFDGSTPAEAVRRRHSASGPVAAS